MEDRHCYLFALEIEPLKVGAIYENLPMHLTLVHRFWISLNPEKLADKIRPILTKYPRVTFVPGEVVELGPKKTRVYDLEQIEKLKELHMELFELLNKLGTEYTELDWVGLGYVPHASVRENSPISTGNLFSSKAVYIIEVKVPGFDHRRFVRQKIKLS
jgi:hypothetical protein